MNVHTYREHPLAAAEEEHRDGAAAAAAAAAAPDGGREQDCASLDIRWQPQKYVSDLSQAQTISLP